MWTCRIWCFYGHITVRVAPFQREMIWMNMDATSAENVLRETFVRDQGVYERDQGIYERDRDIQMREMKIPALERPIYTHEQTHKRYGHAHMHKRIDI